MTDTRIFHLGDLLSITTGLLARFGETREVSPLRPGDHTVIDPIAELRMMRADIPIIAVVVDPDGEQ